MQQTYIFTNLCLEILNYELTFFYVGKITALVWITQTFRGL